MKKQFLGKDGEGNKLWIGFFVLVISFGLVFGMSLTGLLDSSPVIERKKITTTAGETAFLIYENGEWMGVDLIGDGDIDDLSHEITISEPLDNIDDQELEKCFRYDTETRSIERVVSDLESDPRTETSLDSAEGDDLTLESQDLVDVTDHGAVGDGSTDDYQSIMDAMDYAVQNNKDGVYFPSGTFAISDKIWMNSEYNGLSFISDENAVLKPIHSDATRIFEIKADGTGDVQDITIKGLELDGNVENLAVDRWGNWGIHVWSDDSTARGIKIEDINAHDFSGNGLYIDSSDTTVKNFLSHHNWGHGFATGNSAQNVTFENITAHNNFSPDNPNVGSGFDIHGGYDVKINNFTLRENGYGMKTSLGQPTATVTNGVIKDNNERGYRTTGDPPTSMYFENVEVSGNGASGMEFRYQGGEVIMNNVSILNNGQDSSLNDNGALLIYDEYDNFHIENITVENHPGIGINSYTSGLTIEQMDISGTEDTAISPNAGPISLEPTELQDSIYTIDDSFDLEPFEVQKDSVVINGEELRAVPETGDVEVDLDTWTVDNREFTAYASDSVTFEMSGLESYTSYSIYQGGTLKEYVSTDSEGYLQFENSDWSSNDFTIQQGGVNVVTQEPTDITNNTAVLHGEVTDMGDQSELDVFFRYHEVDTEGWNEIGYQSITAPTKYEEKITGLSPGTSYEYKAVAQWDDGEMAGEVVSFSTGFETDPYDWQGFLSPEDGDVIYEENFSADLSTIIDSVPESDDDGDGTTLDYWGEFYIDGQYDGEKQLNSEPDHTEYLFEGLDRGTYDLRVEWHYDLGLIESDEITVTLEKAESDFGLSDLYVDPVEMYVDTEMNVQVDVENIGTYTGDYTAEFYKDSSIIGSDTVTVEPGQTKTASIAYTVSEAGNFEISVENLTQSITVSTYPDVSTDIATNITSSSSDLQGEVIDLGMESAVSAYFRYRKIGNTTWMETATQTILGEEKYNLTVEALEGKTEYEYQAVIAWNESQTEGEILNFTTEENMPEIKTLRAANVTESSAELIGEVTDLGDSEKVNVSFRIRERGQESWIESSEPQTVSDVGVFSELWSNLAPSTVYEYEALLESDDKVLTGERKIFGTGLHVETYPASDIGIDSAELQGELAGLGDNRQVEVFFEYRRQDEMEWKATEAETKDETGEFRKKISELKSNETYEFRTVAEGESTEVGKTQTFTTRRVAPVLTDLTPSIGQTINGEKLKISAEMEHPLDYELGRAFVEIDGSSPLEAEVIGDKAILELENTLDDGEHRYEFYMEDEKGNRNSTTVTFSVDNALPYLSIEIENQEEDASLLMKGETERDVQVFINAQEVNVRDDGNFAYEATLQKGKNTFEVIARNEVGKTVKREYTALYLPQLSDLKEEIDELENKTDHIGELIYEIDDLIEQNDENSSDVEEELNSEFNELDRALDENVTILEEALEEHKIELIDDIDANLTELEEDLIELEEETEQIYDELQKETDQEEQRELDSDILFAAFGFVIIVLAVLVLSLIRTKSKAVYSEGEESETELEDWIEETVDGWFEKKQA